MVYLHFLDMILTDSGKLDYFYWLIADSPSPRITKNKIIDSNLKNCGKEKKKRYARKKFSQVLEMHRKYD